MTGQFLRIIPFPSLFHASSFDEQVFNKNASNNKVDNIFEAVMITTKAARYEMEVHESMISRLIPHFVDDLSRIVGFTIFQPLIVFQGKMYGVTQKDDEPQLEPIKFAQIPKRYVSSKYNEILGRIHVVSYDSFDEYLSILKSFYWRHEKKLMDKQKELVEFVKSLSPKQPRFF